MAVNSKEGKLSDPKTVFTITALIEGIYFGLGMLFLAPFLLGLLSTAEITALEIYFVRLVGVFAIAFTVGCLRARRGDEKIVRLMSLIMSTVKAGATLLLTIKMLSVPTLTIIGWINPILTVFLFYINFQLYRQTSN
ncbi:MAG: hypothetical protein ACOCVD_03670 [Bacillota bacterium]